MADAPATRPADADSTRRRTTPTQLYCVVATLLLGMALSVGVFRVVGLKAISTALQQQHWLDPESKELRSGSQLLLAKLSSAESGRQKARRKQANEQEMPRMPTKEAQHLRMRKRLFGKMAESNGT